MVVVEICYPLKHRPRKRISLGGLKLCKLFKLTSRPSPAQVSLFAPITRVENAPNQSFLLVIVSISGKAKTYSTSGQSLLRALGLPNGPIRDFYNCGLTPNEYLYGTVARTSKIA